MNVYLEIFGYIGTALVIVSMMMTSVVKLRIINMCGGLISLIYAVCVNTWPVAVLNVCLICINLVQTVRLLKGREDLTQVCLEGHDPTAEHLLNAWRTDFEKCNPACNLEEISKGKVHILYVGATAVGFLTDTQNSGIGGILYLTSSHRTASIRERALAMFAKQN